jgi:hypothetical protein
VSNGRQDCEQYGRVEANCGLHPLIHTFTARDLAQDVEKKKVEPKTPHFFSLNQDIVAWSQKQKCGLKYVMHSPRDK